jgi:predicted Zn-dependent peptidase
MLLPTGVESGQTPRERSILIVIVREVRGYTHRLAFLRAIHYRRRMRSCALALVIAVDLVSLSARAADQSGTAETAPAAPNVHIEFEKFTLPSGLVLIVSRDSAVPEVAVNVSYSVGSRVERPGRTGFAHLFEHLMFMGTERAPTKMFDAWMEQSGGRNNAWTAEDRTDYFDIAPPTALPLVLWLEADRMRDLGHLIDREKLDLQRSVVRNERRQNIENRPYGVIELELPELVWPVSHPYHHPVIGSHKDLAAASVEDVRSFFETYYDPANASIVVAGDVDTERVRAEVGRLFGAIPSKGKPSESAVLPTSRPEVLPPSETHRTVSDNVELAKVVIAWRSPPHFVKGDAELDLVASVLSNGKASRLYRSLVYDRKLAQDVSATQQSHSLGSEFVVEATVRPSVAPAVVEQALFEQIGKLAAERVPMEELERAKNEYEMSFVERLQSVAERASLLNMYEAETGNPGYIGADLDRYRAATPDDLMDVVRRVLSHESAVVLTVLPKKAEEPR